jgi:hypothetical protein
MAKAIEKEKDAVSVEQVIDELATKANVALKEMEDFDQEKNRPYRSRNGDGCPRQTHAVGKNGG